MAGPGSEGRGSFLGPDGELDGRVPVPRGIGAILLQNPRKHPLAPRRRMPHVQVSPAWAVIRSDLVSTVGVLPGHAGPSFSLIWTGPEARILPTAVAESVSPHSYVTVYESTVHEIRW